MICAGCLGSRSDDFNEIVECDGCGVTVHEGDFEIYINYIVLLYKIEEASDCKLLLLIIVIVYY